jgi:signal transduction histidine kinase
MTSLRRRLTISYTVLVGAFISLVAIVLTWVAFDAVVRPIGEAIESGASAARAIVSAEPEISADELAVRVRNLVARSDVMVFVARRPGPLPGALGLFGPGRGGPGIPVPAFGGLSEPDAPGEFGGAARDQFDPPPCAFGGGPNVNFETFANVHGEFVNVRGTQLVIVPLRATLEARARQYLAMLATVVLLAIVVAWLIARWMAAQAVAPLVAVTAELRRFAAGDFTPKSVQLGGGSDVGQLIEAYNGAAAQVVAAFEERERVEGRMRRFLADAGHELRTPLSIVIAYVEVLRKGGIDARVSDQAFSTLATETTRMRRLVDRLVALARLDQPETTQPAVIDVGALAGDAVVAIVAARGGDVVCEAESGTFVLADPADLHEAIANLVDNAIKYGAGTPVRVAVEHERNAIAVRVSDRGPGIAAAEREKIFERFYRGAGGENIEGSGLGLAIAVRAAKRAGGELSLESGDGGKTVFTLRLPFHVVVSVG